MFIVHIQPLRNLTSGMRKSLAAFLILSVLYLEVEGQEGFRKSIVRHAIEKHILRGELANLGQFSWHTHLTMFNVSKKWICGGSLISEKWILTAAHCLVWSDKVGIKFGALNSSNATHKSASKTFKLHPDFNIKNNNNDIALIQLPRAVPLKKIKGISIIRLPSLSQVNETFTNYTAHVSGFGDHDTTHKISEALRYGNVKIISNGECSPYFHRGLVVNSTICSIGITSMEHNTCSGDSGGALVITEDDGNWTQVGIASFGSSDGCFAKIPKCLTRVTSYLHWISDTTGVKLRA